MRVTDSQGRTRTKLAPLGHAQVAGAVGAHTDSAHADAVVINSKASKISLTPWAPVGTFDEIGASVTIDDPAVAVLMWWVAPFTMSLPILQWFAGAGSAGNYDWGIYSADGGTCYWRKGSTAFPAVNATTAETITPTLAVVAGTTYIIAFQGDQGKATVREPSLLAFAEATLDVNGDACTARLSNVFPLPATITPPPREVGGVNVPAFRLRVA